MIKRALIILILVAPILKLSAEVADGIADIIRQNAEQYEGPSLSVRHYDAIMHPDPTTRQASEHCDRFIDESGNLGDYGTKLVEAIRDVSRDCFYNKIDFSYLCPNYANFDDAQKTQFLVFMFASMSTFESACRADTQVQGKNGLADGLFQLEYGQVHRQNAARDPQFCATNTPVDTQDITFQMECSASIFATTHCNGNTQPGNYSSDYWLKLRPESGGGDRSITKMIKMFPGCASNS